MLSVLVASPMMRLRSTLGLTWLPGEVEQHL
jgi:hypothetical protein